MVVSCFLCLFPAVAVYVVSGVIHCGDHAGTKCGSWFSDAVCDSKDGACCHDDFNAWCCPPNFKCDGVFHDPGGNNHCMTYSKVTSSCLCTQTDYEIVEMTPTGETKVEDSWDTKLTACCQNPTEHCGWTGSITKSDSQTVSWSNTAEVGFHMTWNVEAGPDLKLGEIGFEVKDSFTYGQSSTTSGQQTYSSGCTCDADHCKSPVTNIVYELKVVYSTQPVQITARKCGVDKILPGTVKTSQFMGNYQCLITPLQKTSDCQTPPVHNTTFVAV